MKINDEIILKLLSEGNSNSYTYLFKKYHDQLVSQANYILKDVAEAEDQVQDLFVDIIDKKIIINVKSSLKGYLSTCIYHKCIHVINSNKTRQLKIENFKRLHEAYLIETPFNKKDTQCSADRLLGKLSGQRVKVCKLVYWENRKYKEVASELGITVNSIKTHLRLANRSLREQCDNSRSNMIKLLYA